MNKKDMFGGLSHMHQTLVSHFQNKLYYTLYTYLNLFLSGIYLVRARLFSESGHVGSLLIRS